MTNPKTVEDSPRLIAQWDWEKNTELGLDPKNLKPMSNKKAWWICKDHPEHSWETTIATRSRSKYDNGCPYCRGSKVLVGFNDLGTTDPYLAEELVNPEDAFKHTRGSNQKVLWKCGKHSVEATWEALICNRTLGDAGCPYCSGNRVLKGDNTLEKLRPDLWSELLVPMNCTTGSHKKAVWKCDKHHYEYTWESTIKDRTRPDGSGCPRCAPQNSKVEDVLENLIPKSIRNFRVIPKKEVDLFVPNERLIIEYDGSYWHKDKADKDLEYTRLMLDLGYRVVRIREQTKTYPLPPLPVENENLLQIEVDYARDNSHVINIPQIIGRWLLDK